MIINPFGERYPEKNFSELIGFELIKNYVEDGGIFVNTGGLAFFIGWDVNSETEGNREKPITNEKILAPVTVRMQDTSPMGAPVFSVELREIHKFSGSLLWRELGVKTTSDTPGHSGVFEGTVYQTPEDQAKFGNLIDIGESPVVHEFRAITNETENCIPLLRLRRPDFGEVYPIAAVPFGEGYFLICGLDTRHDTEFNKISTAVDRFCDWYSHSSHTT